MSILAIIALGVGFFSGLRATKPSMILSASDYLNSKEMCDYVALSTIGYKSDEIDSINADSRIEKAVGGYNVDFLTDFEGKGLVLRAHLLTDDINKVHLIDGVMPSKPDECLADAEYFEDIIGKKIVISSANDEDTKDAFKNNEYTVVGTVYSPMYLNHQKGNTSLGNGKLDSFIFLGKDSLNFEYYNELYVNVKNDDECFSEEYDKFSKDYKDNIKNAVLENVEPRYNDAIDELNENKEKVEKGLDEIHSIDKNMLDPSVYPEKENDPNYLKVKEAVSKEGELQETLDEINDNLENLKCEVYVKSREDNLGYSSFENDVNIVDGVAKAFPIFFFLISALICATTMSRIINEERTEIGSLYSIGHSKSNIYFKYIIYAGLPAIIGCLIGFYLGNSFLPIAIWKAYEMMYCLPDFSICYDYSILVISLVVSLMCSVGITSFTLIKTLKESPASLLRPKAPIVGKKIFFEKIPFLWNNLKFTYKITIRNIFRYKMRVTMTIIGIAGCTALVLTGLGIKDSISNIAGDQFSEIQLYDMFVLYSDGIEAENLDNLPSAINNYVKLKQTTVDMKMSNDEYKTINLMVTDEEKYPEYFTLKNDDTSYGIPEKGNVIIDEQTAINAGVELNDNIDLKLESGSVISLKVSGIVKNYVYHYIHMSAETYNEYFDDKYVANTIFVRVDDSEDIYALSTKVQEDKDVSYVGIMEDTKESVEDVMKALNLVVYVIIFCAGLLSFIVLLNLGNINIAEREREIATIKVLGFYPNETTSYIFRENIILTIVGILIGLHLGKLLHMYVMKQIVIDVVTFKSQIYELSFVISVVLVFLFTLIVDFILRRSIKKVDMVGALKSNE